MHAKFPLPAVPDRPCNTPNEEVPSRLAEYAHGVKESIPLTFTFRNNLPSSTVTPNDFMTAHNMQGIILWRKSCQNYAQLGAADKLSPLRFSHTLRPTHAYDSSECGSKLDITPVYSTIPALLSDSAGFLACRCRGIQIFCLLIRGHLPPFDTTYGLVPEANAVSKKRISF